MMFEDVHSMWTERRLTQEEAAQLLGVCPRTFRRWSARYEADGIEGLRDRRLSRASHRAAPVDEVMRMVDRYRRRHEGWNVRHFYSWYRRDGGTRSYGWVKDHLQKAGAVPRSKGRGKHRKRREPAPWPGIAAAPGRQRSRVGRGRALGSDRDDGRRHERALLDVLLRRGGHLEQLPGSAGDDRGEGPVLFAVHGPGLALLGHAYGGRQGGQGQPDAVRAGHGAARHRDDPAYSPEARGRSERAFGTHQGRLPRELAAAGIADMESANRYLREVYLPAFNAEFARPAREQGSAFVPCADPAALDDILCEIHERVVGRDNCVRFEQLALQLPADRHRPHYVEARVKVRRHADGALSVWHGPRKLARYGPGGERLAEELPVAA